MLFGFFSFTVGITFPLDMYGEFQRNAEDLQQHITWIAGEGEGLCLVICCLVC